MTRGETFVTVFGLLGTFLLPWPGEPGEQSAAARDRQGIRPAASRMAEPQSCRETKATRSSFGNRIGAEARKPGV